MTKREYKSSPADRQRAKVANAKKSLWEQVDSIRSWVDDLRDWVDGVSDAVDGLEETLEKRLGPRPKKRS